jgi:hypothetical protein
MELFGLYPWQMADFYPEELALIDEYISERNKAARG